MAQGADALLGGVVVRIERIAARRLVGVRLDDEPTKLEQHFAGVSVADAGDGALDASLVAGARTRAGST
jgi:hypothetical protein